MSLAFMSFRAWSKEAFKFTSVIASWLARLVLTDSYRGIALSGSNTTLPSIIRLGGVVRFRCPNCFPSALNQNSTGGRARFPRLYGEGGRAA
jgi:hypothetical protein